MVFLDVFRGNLIKVTLRKDWFVKFIKKYPVISKYIIFTYFRRHTFLSEKKHLQERSNWQKLTNPSSPSKSRKGPLFTIKSKIRACSKQFIDKKPTYEHSYPPIQLKNQVTIHHIVYRQLLIVVHHIPVENYYTLHLVVEKNCHQEKTPC